MAKKPKTSDLFDLDEEKRMFARIMLPYFVEGFRKGVGIAAEQGEGVADPQDVFDREIMKSLRVLSFKEAARAAKTSQKQLTRVVNSVLADGGGISDLTTAINQSFTFSARWKAQRLARTELTGVIGRGTTHGLGSEGFTKQRWITAIDGRQRPTHERAHGQEVTIGKKFHIGAGWAEFPGDPNLPVGERVNCRCTTVGAGVPKASEKQIASLFLRVHGSIETRMMAELRREYLRQRDRILLRLPSAL
jgi:hypothetical protein